MSHVALRILPPIVILSMWVAFLVLGEITPLYDLAVLINGQIEADGIVTSEKRLKLKSCIGDHDAHSSCQNRFETFFNFISEGVNFS